MSVAGRKDGLPEFSTNHQTTHWLQHWLMKYLSRQSHITCFSFLSFSQTASEKLCCVCMNPDQWKASRVSLNLKKKKKTTQKRTGGEAKIWTNLIVRKETGLSCNICCNLRTHTVTIWREYHSQYWSSPFLHCRSCKLHCSHSAVEQAAVYITQSNIIDDKSWLTITILIKMVH